MGLRCRMCDRKMSEEDNCGGDCIYCMAFVAEDPTCIHALMNQLEIARGGSPQIYLIRNTTPEPAVHGVDYRKGLAEGEECGLVHEFQTKHCKPTFVTQEQVDAGRVFSSDDLVEIVPLYDEETEKRLAALKESTKP